MKSKSKSYAELLYSYVEYKEIKYVNIRKNVRF